MGRQEDPTQRDEEGRVEQKKRREKREKRKTEDHTGERFL